MIKRNKIVAVIPVRAGSQRLKNKNILPFGDSNLLIHKIRQLKSVESIDEIVVSSDSDEMLEMAINEGVIAQKRPIEYCDEKTKSFNEVVEFVASNVDGAHLMWAPCVCPLTTVDNYKNAIAKYCELVVNNQEYDSLISTKIFKEYLWDENGALNYKLGSQHVLSQNLPSWHIIVNGFYIAPREKMVQWRYLFNENVYKYILTKREAVDIDDAEDFEIAKALLNIETEYGEKIENII